jgi:hypothetical protein
MKRCAEEAGHWAWRPNKIRAAIAGGAAPKACSAKQAESWPGAAREAKFPRRERLHSM